MSAIPPKADIAGRRLDVRFVPFRKSVLGRFDERGELPEGHTVLSPFCDVRRQRLAHIGL
jgi:hypothetical protein